MRIPKPIRQYVKEHLAHIYRDFTRLWAETNNRLSDNLVRCVYSVLHSVVSDVSDHERFSDDYCGLSVPLSIVMDKTKSLFIERTVHNQDYRLPAFEAWQVPCDQRQELLGIYYDFMVKSTIRKLCNKRKTICLHSGWYFFMFLGNDFYRVDTDEYQTHMMVKLGKAEFASDELTGLEGWFKKRAVYRSWKKNQGTSVHEKPIIHVGKGGCLEFTIPRQ